MNNNNASIKKISIVRWTVIGSTILFMSAMTYNLDGIAIERTANTSPCPNDKNVYTMVPTSKYLVGSVAVGIVVVSGPGELKFEDHEVQTIIAEVNESFQSLKKAEPRAKLQFQTDLNVITIDASQRPFLNLEHAEAQWRDPALRKMNVTPSASGPKEYVERLRSQRGTDWAYVVFFTKYEVFGSAYQADERIAIKHNDFAPTGINQVFTHETCHAFGAADETCCKCSDEYGVRKAKNGNCNACDSDLHSACVMENSGTGLCKFTRLQIGWDPSLFPH